MPRSAWAFLAGGGLLLACSGGAATEARRTGGAAEAEAQETGRSGERERMVDRQIEARGIRDPRVLEALRTVPRHRFVPPALQDQAYADTPLPIGSSQTISQPYIVAYMTEALRLPPAAAVLEIGTGSGYQAAVLAEVAREVYSIEIVPELAERSARVLAELWLRQHPPARGRRLPRLAGGGPVRRHHGDRRARPRAARARGATCARRPAGHSGGPLRAGHADRDADGRRVGLRDDHPGAFRADDGRAQRP